ncbi:restriction endonuclease subunit S [Candidatus Bipolaricaulota bacterium]|nr:restriction endonuclease subunit S [Candidatus Bipolaricaulota bacterium]
MKAQTKDNTRKSSLKSNFQPYPKYKDSKNRWLGKIPIHWDTIKLKFCSKINPPKSELGDLDPETKVTFIPMEKISTSGGLNREETKKIEDVYDGYTNFQENDILIAKITPCFENGKGGLANNLKNGLGFGSTEFLVVRPTQVLDNRFFFYLTKTSFFRKIGEGEMKGAAGQKRVPNNFFRNFPQILPPKEEQKIIVNFLDRETSKIDRLIEKQEKLIDLLEEKRTALISKTITHGVSQDTEMEDSGIEWLMKKPKNWDVLKLKHCCEINPNKSEITAALLDKKATFLPMEHIGFGEILDSSETGIVGELKDGFTYFREGDVLVAKITPCFENGKGALAKDLTNRIGFGTTELHVLRPNEKTSNKFLLYLTNSGFFRKVGERMMHGSAGQKRVPSKFIKNFPVFLPPLDKQEQIVKYLEDKLSNIDRVVQKNLESIKQLKEYRTALISAAVTGKIDVRGEV